MKLFDENSEHINDNSILELIFVVADGEGSEEERQIVFSTIAQNSELQRVFQNAIKMNKVGELEIQNSTPPSHLTNNLMRNLGFDDTTILNSNIELENQKIIKNSKQKFKYPKKILNGILLLLLLIFSGYIGYILGENESGYIGYIFGENESGFVVNSQKVENDLVNIQENLKENYQNQYLNQSQNQNNYIERNSLIDKNEHNIIKNKIKYEYQNSLNDKTSAITDLKNQGLSILDKIENEIINIDNYKITQVNPIFINQALSFPKKNNNILDSRTQSINRFKKMKILNQNDLNQNNNISENQIDFLDLILQFKNSVFKSKNSNNNGNQIYENQDEFDNKNELTNLENKEWIIQFNTKNDFQFSHDLFSENINNQLRSFELITLYKVDDNLFVGGKIGNEYLPIYYINGEKYNLTKNFYSITGNIRYVLPNQKFIVEDLIQPYINLSLGGTSAGLYSGAGVGGNVYIYSNVNFSFGVEFNNLTYFNNNGYFNINKTSSNIGISYIF